MNRAKNVVLWNGAGDAVWRAQVAEFVRINKGRRIYSRPTATGTEVFVRDRSMGLAAGDLKAAREDGANLLTALGLMPGLSRMVGTQWGVRGRAKRALDVPDDVLLGRHGAQYGLGDKLCDDSRPIHRATGPDGATVVVKVLPNDKDGEREAKVNLNLQKLSHENLLNCVDLGVKAGEMQLVMEHAPHGEASRLFEQAQKLRNAKVFKKELGAIKANLDGIITLILQDALQGLVAMHEAGLLHLDIRLQNIFIGTGCVGKLGDFGTSRKAGEVFDEKWQSTPNNMAPEHITGNTRLANSFNKVEKERRRLEKAVKEGKLNRETAQEQFNKFKEKHVEKYALNAKADIYAFGLLAHFILHGEDLVPGTGPEVRSDAIFRSYERVKTPQNTPVGHRTRKNLENLVNACVQRSVGDRPTAAQLLDHEVFASLKDAGHVKYLRSLMEGLLNADLE
jgi:serine/threonine protein kinase